MGKKVKSKKIIKDIRATGEKILQQVQDATEETVLAVENVANEVKKDRLFARILGIKHIKKLGFLGIAIILIGGIGTSAYFYKQYVKSRVLGTQNDNSEMNVTVESVGKLMDLPSEKPTVATVSDIEKLKSQPFFDRAKNGDRVLIYQGTKRVILYRPSTNKIIDVATINMGDPTPVVQNPLNAAGEPTISASPLKEKAIVKIVIWNGTTTTGLTRQADAKLEGINGINIIDRDNSQKRGYEQNLVVNLRDIPKERVQEIADALQADVVELPPDEDAPDADILVILGSEFVGQ